MFCYSWELDSAVLMDWFIQFKLGGLLIIWPWLFEIHTKSMPQVHTDMPDISHPHPPKHGKRKACQLKHNLWETITFLWSWYLSNKFHYETLVGVIIISTVSKVGGFNLLETYARQIVGVKKYLKPPPGFISAHFFFEPTPLPCCCTLFLSPEEGQRLSQQAERWSKPKLVAYKKVRSDMCIYIYTFIKAKNKNYTLDLPYPRHSDSGKQRFIRIPC